MVMFARIECENVARPYVIGYPVHTHDSAPGFDDVDGDGLRNLLEPEAPCTAEPAQHRHVQIGRTPLKTDRSSGQVAEVFPGIRSLLAQHNSTSFNKATLDLENQTGYHKSATRSR